MFDMKARGTINCGVRLTENNGGSCLANSAPEKGSRAAVCPITQSLE
jgi:hypothetical protein